MWSEKTFPKGRLLISRPGSRECCVFCTSIIVAVSINESYFVCEKAGVLLQICQLNFVGLLSEYRYFDGLAIMSFKWLNLVMNEKPHRLYGFICANVLHRLPSP